MIYVVMETNSILHRNTSMLAGNHCERGHRGEDDMVRMDNYATDHERELVRKKSPQIRMNERLWRV